MTVTQIQEWLSGWAVKSQKDSDLYPLSSRTQQQIDNEYLDITHHFETAQLAFTMATADALENWMGPRCPDHDPECPCCAAWDAHDAYITAITE